MGHWEVNPKLPSAPGESKTQNPDTPTSLSASEGPNIFFETHEGSIDVSVAWMIRDKTVKPPRAKLEAISHHGAISIINTIRPDDLPLHIKVASRETGEVKIVAPHEFRGVLALRIPAPCPDWRAQIILAEKMSEQVSCTRETTSRVKGKNRTAPIGSTNVPEEQMLVELLIGSDLDVADFSSIHTSGADALDFIEVESNGGRIMILSSEDAALGNDQFPDPEVRSQRQGAERTYRLRGLANGGLGLTVRQGSDEADRGAGPPITLVINEPKWVGHVMKKLNKWGADGRGGSMRYMQEMPSSFSSRRRPFGAEGMPRVRTVLRLTACVKVRVQAPTPSRTPEPPASPPASVRSHPGFRRRLSEIVYSDLQDESLRPPAGMRRSCRSASASSLNVFQPTERTDTPAPTDHDLEFEIFDDRQGRRSEEYRRDDFFPPRHAYSDDGIDIEPRRSMQSTSEVEVDPSDMGSPSSVPPPLPHSRTFPAPSQPRLRNSAFSPPWQQNQTSPPQRHAQLPPRPLPYPRSQPLNTAPPLSLYPAVVAASLSGDAPSSGTPLPPQGQSERARGLSRLVRARPSLSALDVPGSLLRKSQSQQSLGRNSDIA